MTPQARIQAAIEVLGEVIVQAKAGGRAADDVMRGYFRKRRYAGSKDRRAVGEYVYSVLRDYQRLAWASKSLSSRGLMITHLALNKALNLDDFSGEGHAPKALNEDEKALLKQLENLDDAPLFAQVNCPEWLVESLEKRFKNNLKPELLALNERAPLDLRVNTIKSNNGKVLSELLKEKLKRKNTEISPNGIRVEDAPNLSNLKAFRDGFFEVQDEAAQIASLLCGAKSGMTVVDLCAGGGGKSLALAAIMENKGKIHALDISEKRLQSLKERSKRAGVKIINSQTIKGFEADKERKEALEPLKGKADIVVLDVPCSGTGTWRRSPELRLRLNEAGLAELQTTQLKLMEEGAKLLKPGGRLIYMTCSLLSQENEDQIKAFLKGHNTWRQIGYTKVWEEVSEKDCPKTLSLDNKCLQLTPHTHGTDGFFVGILKKPI